MEGDGGGGGVSLGAQTEVPEIIGFGGVLGGGVRVEGEEGVDEGLQVAVEALGGIVGDPG